MSAYQSFTTSRTTEPDATSLLAQLRASVDGSAGVQHTTGTSSFVVKKGTDWTAAQIAAAQTIIDTAPASSAGLTTQAAVDAMPLLEKAILLILLDQLNTIRASLVPPLGAITPAQAIAAVRQKAGTLS
jgi:hypothetical protein